jgi:hypothetical protein
MAVIDVALAWSVPLLVFLALLPFGLKVAGVVRANVLGNWRSSPDSTG